MVGVDLLSNDSVDDSDNAGIFNWEPWWPSKPRLAQEHRRGIIGDPTKCLLQLHVIEQLPARLPLGASWLRATIGQLPSPPNATSPKTGTAVDIDRLSPL